MVAHFARNTNKDVNPAETSEGNREERKCLMESEITQNRISEKSLFYQERCGKKVGLGNKTIWIGFSKQHESHCQTLRENPG